MAAGGSLGPHVGGPWRCQGLGLGPGLARGRQNGLDCTSVRAGAMFYWDPGIQGTAKVEGDLDVLGPTINETIARFKELVVFDWTAPPQPGGTL